MSEYIPERASQSDLHTLCDRHRNKIDREKDAWWAVSELAKGRTYRDIAADLSKKNGYSLSRQQVWDDINEVFVEWKKANMDNIGTFIARELVRLEELETKVLRAYEKSKVLRPKEYEALMKRGYTMEEIDQMYEERGGLPGDPRYLETLLHLQKQRLDILGIGKGNDIGTQTIVQYQFNGASLDELGKIADLLQDQKSQEIIDIQ